MLTLQNRSNQKNSTGKYSWQSISKLVQNVTGQVFDPQSFQMKYDASPILQQVVSSFDDNGVTLAVKNSQEEPINNPSPDGAGIKSSAMNAAKKTLQRP